MKENTTVDQLGVSVDQAAQLAVIIEDGTVNASAAAQLFGPCCEPVMMVRRHWPRNISSCRKVMPVNSKAWLRKCWRPMKRPWAM